MRPARVHHEPSQPDRPGCPRSGVAPGTVRLSVGLEDVDDLVWDLERGLQAARSSAVTA